ncbi:hypothetical protein ACWEWF_32025, partial [Streptomyces sp. NPDC003857]
MWRPEDARARFRGGLSGPTAGCAAGHTQANLVSVPADWAYDTLLFCQRNPKPCPVLDVTDAGSFTTVLADGADLRTDLPRYRVWQDGELAVTTLVLGRSEQLPGEFDGAFLEVVAEGEVAA